MGPKKDPRNKCPGCKGRKVQKRNDGVNVVCPVCKGSGKFLSPHPGTASRNFEHRPVYIMGLKKKALAIPNQRIMYGLGVPEGPITNPEGKPVKNPWEDS